MFHGDLDLHCYSCNRLNQEQITFNDGPAENSPQIRDNPGGINPALLSNVNDHER